MPISDTDSDLNMFFVIINIIIIVVFSHKGAKVQATINPAQRLLLKDQKIYLKMPEKKFSYLGNCHNKNHKKKTSAISNIPLKSLKKTTMIHLKRTLGY